MRTPLKRWTRVGVGIGAAITGCIVVFACNAVLGVDDFEPGECDEGAMSCTGNAQQRCDAGKWEMLSECDATTCVDGGCFGECAVGSKRCADNRLQPCDESGRWDGGTPCDAGTHCQMGECVEECPSGDIACYGNTPQTCIGGRWEREPDASCIGTTCLLGKCEGDCAPGQGKCSGTTPQTCERQGQWTDQRACDNTDACVGGSCEGPSCAGLARSCGPNQDESCCLSPVVLGDRYRRSNDLQYPAEVGDFRLDQFEITVGRFRRFVEAYPVFRNELAEGAGEHSKIPGSGWRKEWDVKLPMDQAALRAAVNDPSCLGGSPTWTEDAGANENLPMNCITWFEAFAFCAWDGGRLPTEAEWNYAAAGGNEQRQYPWSNPPGSMLIDGTYAVFNCSGNPLCDVASIQKVGWKSPQGDGRWRQADLAGNLWEWALDEYAVYLKPAGDADICKDCANTQFASSRVVRGGGWDDLASFLLSTFRNAKDPLGRSNNVGARCARTP